MNVNKFLNKEYQNMSFKELYDVPFDAIKGISESDAKRIREAFKPKALSRYVNIAQAIVTLAEGEVED